MSALSSPVVEYRSEPHPNADGLEVAEVDGWRVVCRVGQFASGGKVAYIPEGALLPWSLVVGLGLHDPPQLAGSGHDHVKATSVRGVLSQGLIYAGPLIESLAVGDDAADSLGLVKWTPQVPEHLEGIMVPGPQIDFDIDDIKSWPGRMKVGEPAVVTEKIHGTFCCLGVRRDMPGSVPYPVVSSKGPLSKGLRFDVGAYSDAHDPHWRVHADADNLYVGMWRVHADAVISEFERLGSRTEGLYCFGEIHGPDVQEGTDYGLSHQEFRMFDLRVGDEYAPWDEIVATAERVGVRCVPVLWSGRWHEGLIADQTSGPSAIARCHREGIVVRPAGVRYDHGLKHPSGRGPGRLIFKSVSERHLLRPEGTEYR